MTNIESINRFIMESPLRYLEYQLTPWGRMFRDADNPESYLSNYAVICKETNIEQSMEELEAYYQAKHVLPKILSNPDSLPLKILRPFFEKHGYSVRLFEEQQMILEKPEQSRHTKNCSIKKSYAPLTGPEYDLCIEQDEGETYGVKMINRQIRAGACAFVAYSETGAPVCMALAEPFQNAVYVSDLYTTPAMRGQGYGAAVIEAIKAAYPDFLLFLDAATENAVRIYTRAGFSTRTVPHWWAIKGELPEWCKEDS